MDEDRPKVGHPREIKQYDLSKSPDYVRESGGAAPKNSLWGVRSDNRTPHEMMTSLGFAKTDYMTPLQFLIAVMNDDLDLIFKNDKRRTRMEGKGGIALSYRLEAAKTAARYLHMEMPKVSVQDKTSDQFSQALQEALDRGEHRVHSRKVIIEQIEQISPDIPLAPANYPPDFIDVDPSVQEEDVIEHDE